MHTLLHDKRQQTCSPLGEIPSLHHSSCVDLCSSLPCCSATTRTCLEEACNCHSIKDNCSHDTLNQSYQAHAQQCPAHPCPNPPCPAVLSPPVPRPGASSSASWWRMRIRPAAWHLTAAATIDSRSFAAETDLRLPWPLPPVDIHCLQVVVMVGIGHHTGVCMLAMAVTCRVGARPVATPLLVNCRPCRRLPLSPPQLAVA